MDIYDEIDRRTGTISAYAIMKDGHYVARAIFRNDAACTCYFQVWGAPPQKGIARGGNYDRHSAAAEVAAAKIEKIESGHGGEAIRVQVRELLSDPKRDGYHWDQNLTEGGFEVARVI